MRTAHPRHHTIRLAGLAMIGALVLGIGPAAAGTAGASVPTRVVSPQVLAAVKANGALAIAKRTAQLSRLEARLSTAPGCDAGGKIAGVITADIPALNSLNSKLQAETTVEAARADIKSAYDDYRVFAVVTPQAFAASACGRIQRVTSTLATDEGKLETRVKAAAAAGADMSGATVSLTDMSAKIADATTNGNKAFATISGLVPDHGNASVIASNQAAVDSARTQLIKARADLVGAITDAHSVIATLKNAA